MKTEIINDFNIIIQKLKDLEPKCAYSGYGKTAKEVDKLVDKVLGVREFFNISNS